ncbi:MAG: HlyD family efflux transporter periplasmic adaptor subunit [Xanthomonadaceae bacterium]|jgi:HlyD family secretion protein|nr:HlyD family efflux transporter periplasmic adaptor subunit [Xanthomonadaceae bacterium]
MTLSRKKRWIPILLAICAAAIVGFLWKASHSEGFGDGFVSSNGRIEATEINIATKFAGRVQDILVSEGDFVKAGQPLAQMQIDTLQAQLEEATAQRQQAITTVANAEAQVAVRESDYQASLALVVQRESEHDAARRRLARSETLVREGALSEQELDDNRASTRSAQATVTAAKAQVAAAQAAVIAAKTQVDGARATAEAAAATIVRIEADIRDSTLVAPRDGRVQFRVAQPGEVLASGGRVLNLIDLSDVYMTFFVPTDVAGRLAMGSDVRIVLDAAPQFVIPARVSFVASTAQFTPRTVETASERQKLMFRVRAQIDPELLQQHLTQVKTGLPGVAWVKIDSKASWPEQLTVRTN